MQASETILKKAVLYFARINHGSKLYGTAIETQIIGKINEYMNEVGCTDRTTLDAAMLNIIKETREKVAERKENDSCSISIVLVCKNDPNHPHLHAYNLGTIRTAVVRSSKPKDKSGKRVFEAVPKCHSDHYFGEEWMAQLINNAANAQAGIKNKEDLKAELANTAVGITIGRSPKKVPWILYRDPKSHRITRRHLPRLGAVGQSRDTAGHYFNLKDMCFQSEPIDDQTPFRLIRTRPSVMYVDFTVNDGLDDDSQSRLVFLDGNEFLSDDTFGASFESSLKHTELRLALLSHLQTIAVNCSISPDAIGIVPLFEDSDDDSEDDVVVAAETPAKSVEKPVVISKYDDVPAEEKAEVPREVPKAEKPQVAAEVQKEKEAPKAEVPKAEEAKAEVPKAEVPKAEVPKAEAPKEVLKAEAPKVEEQIAEVPKAEVPKEVPKSKVVPKDLDDVKPEPKKRRDKDDDRMSVMSLQSSRPKFVPQFTDKKP